MGSGGSDEGKVCLATAGAVLHNTLTDESDDSEVDDEEDWAEKQTVLAEATLTGPQVTGKWASRRCMCISAWVVRVCRRRGWAASMHVFDALLGTNANQDSFQPGHRQVRVCAGPCACAASASDLERPRDGGASRRLDTFAGWDGEGGCALLGPNLAAALSCFGAAEEKPSPATLRVVSLPASVSGERTGCTYLRQCRSNVLTMHDAPTWLPALPPTSFLHTGCSSQTCAHGTSCAWTGCRAVEGWAVPQLAPPQPRPLNRLVRQPRDHGSH